jgi:hypothetical protein
MSTNAVMNLACGDHEVSEWYNYTSNCTPYRHVTDWWPTQVVTNYPILVQDKTKKAFAIGKKLIKSKYVQAAKIEQFIELVELIESEL